MTIIELQYFVSIAETGSFSKTAELFYTTQSTVSKHIVNIEAELNVKLLDRSSNGVKITHAGELFLEHAKNIISEYKSLNVSISEYLQRSGNKITIGMHCLASHYNTVPIILDFKKEHPQLEINFSYLSNWDIFDALSSGKCNIGIMYDENVDELKYDSIPLLNDRLILAVSNSHKFAGRKSISIKELKDEPQIITANRTQIQSLIKHACKSAGFEPVIKEIWSFPEPILSSLKFQNYCLLFLQKALQYYTLNGISLIPLQEEIEAHLVAIHLKHKRLSQAEKDLISYLKLAAKKGLLNKCSTQPAFIKCTQNSV